MLVSFGFAALKTIAKIAVPNFILTIVFISFSLIKSRLNFSPQMISSDNNKIDISQAITMIIGS